MSYEIEKGKRVVVIPVGERGRDLGCYHDDPAMAIFLAAVSSNNVSPRTFDWHCFACCQESIWQGEFQMPERVWTAGRAADAGGIKPWDKYTSGISYLQSWKRACNERARMTNPDGTLRWDGLVVSFHSSSAEKAKEINAAGPEMFEFERNDLGRRQKLFEAFKRLRPDGISSWTRQSLCTPEQVLDALYLYCNRDHLPFVCSLGARADDPFLRAADNFVAPPPPPKRVRPKPGQIIELDRELSFTSGIKARTFKVIQDGKSSRSLAFLPFDAAGRLLQHHHCKIRNIEALGFKIVVQPPALMTA